MIELIRARTKIIPALVTLVLLSLFSLPLSPTSAQIVQAGDILGSGPQIFVRATHQDNPPPPSFLSSAVHGEC